MGDSSAKVGECGEHGPHIVSKKTATIAMSIIRSGSNAGVTF